MRVFVVCLLAACASAASYPQDDASGLELAHQQQDINSILYRVTEPIRSGRLKDRAEQFDPEADSSVYTDKGRAVRKLMTELKEGRLLAREHWFTLFNSRQRQETLMLFDVFIKCKTWEALINNAAYFRDHMNEGVFVYAVYTGVIHSKLRNGVILPPLYEVTPHLFTTSKTISLAYTAQMMKIPGRFRMEHTGSDKNPEQRVAYFGEDIGLNVNHVSWHYEFPFWWDDAYGYHIARKGELFYWVHHQLTVRHDSERLSNYLNFVEELYWDKPIKHGFSPHIGYRYGGAFPSRPDNLEFQDVDNAVAVRDMIIIETRIRDAIAHGYITKTDGSHIDIRDEHGIDFLGNIIESSLYSPNPEYYGAMHIMAHILLGGQCDPHGKFDLPPSAFEHFETTLRDTSFFRLHKYMDNIYKEHKNSLIPYTKEQIYFAGISLDDVLIVGDLETFFEDFEFDIGSAVQAGENVEAVDVTAVVSRLNHEPFSLKFLVTNTDGEEKDGVFRVYLCPKHDGNGVIMSFEESRWHCIEVDKFWKKLAPGHNTINRASKDSSVTVQDLPSFKKLIRDANAAVSAGTSLHLEEFNKACGMPNRLLIPKGKTTGMDFVLAVALTDGKIDATHGNLEDLNDHSHAQCGVHGEVYPDHKPLGYPFDRHIEDERIVMSAPNMKFPVVTIKHMGHK